MRKRLLALLLAATAAVQASNMTHFVAGSSAVNVEQCITACAEQDGAPACLTPDLNISALVGPGAAAWLGVHREAANGAPDGGADAIPWGEARLHRELKAELEAGGLLATDLVRAWAGGDNALSKKEFLMNMKALINDEKMWDYVVKDAVVDAFDTIDTADEGVACAPRPRCRPQPCLSSQRRACSRSCTAPAAARCTHWPSPRPPRW